MATTKVIDLSVELPPQYMVKQIKKFVLSFAKEKYEGTCSREHGYIVSIVKYMKTISTYLNDNTNNIMFISSFKVLCLKPEVRNKLSCVVDMLFRHGIFAQINNLKILVPASTLEDFTFNKDVFSKKKINIRKGDTINIIITEIKYEKQNYSCIGKLNFKDKGK